MTSSRRAGALLALSAIVATGCSADLSTADPAPAGPEDEAGMLYVQHVTSGTVTAGDPSGTEAFEVQIDVDPATVFFTDRPARVAGQLQTAAFVDGFAQLFPGSPPNAVLEVQDGDRTISAPVTLEAASYDAATGVLTYTVTNLPAPTEGYASATSELGQVPESFGEASVFIDDAVTSLIANSVHVVTTGESTVPAHVGLVVLEIQPIAAGALTVTSTWSGASLCALYPNHVDDALTAFTIDPGWCAFGVTSEMDAGIAWDDVSEPVYVAVSLAGLGLMGKAFDLHVSSYRDDSYAIVHVDNVLNLP